jgi:hypothetical protein
MPRAAGVEEEEEEEEEKEEEGEANSHRVGFTKAPAGERETEFTKAPASEWWKEEEEEEKNNLAGLPDGGCVYYTILLQTLRNVSSFCSCCCHQPRVKLLPNCKCTQSQEEVWQEKSKNPDQTTIITT